MELVSVGDFSFAILKVDAFEPVFFELGGRSWNLVLEALTRLAFLRVGDRSVATSVTIYKVNNGKRTSKSLLWSDEQDSANPCPQSRL
jgi:hypothetical protein